MARTRWIFSGGKNSHPIFSERSPFFRALTKRLYSPESMPRIQLLSQVSRSVTFNQVERGFSSCARANAGNESPSSWIFAKVTPYSRTALSSEYSHTRSARISNTLKNVISVRSFGNQIIRRLSSPDSAWNRSRSCNSGTSSAQSSISVSSRTAARRSFQTR